MITGNHERRNACILGRTLLARGFDNGVNVKCRILYPKLNARCIGKGKKEGRERPMTIRESFERKPWRDHSDAPLIILSTGTL